MTILDILANFPSAQQAADTINKAADTLGSETATKAKTFLTQLNNHEITAAEFADLMQDLKDEDAADTAADSIELKAALAQAMALLIQIAPSLLPI